MEGGKAITKHEVTKEKKNTKKLKHPADLFLKNLQLIIGAY